MNRLTDISSRIAIACAATGFLAMMLLLVSLPSFPEIECADKIDPYNTDRILRNADLTRDHYNQYSWPVRFITERSYLHDRRDWGDPIAYRSLANLYRCCDTLEDGRIYGATQARLKDAPVFLLQNMVVNDFAYRGPFLSDGLRVVQLMLVATGDTVYMAQGDFDHYFNQLPGGKAYQWRTYWQSSHLQLYKDPGEPMVSLGPIDEACRDLSYQHALTRNTLLYVGLIFLLVLLGATAYRFGYLKSGALLALAPLMTTPVFTENIFGRSIPNFNMALLTWPLLAAALLFWIHAIREWGAKPRREGQKMLVLGCIVILGSVIGIALLAAESFTGSYLYAVPVSLCIFGIRLAVGGIIEMGREKKKSMEEGQ